MSEERAEYLESSDSKSSELTTQTLSLKAVHEQLNARGVAIPYSSLSLLVNTGDIAEQLGVGGKGNKREFPAWSVGFLAGFIPWFEGLKLSRDHAPGAMRGALERFRGSQNITTAQDGDRPSALVPSSVSFGTSELRQNSDIGVVLEKLAEAITERRQAPSDRLLTREQAADLLACNPKSVGRYVKPVRPNTWRESDLFAYIASLKPKI